MSENLRLKKLSLGKLRSVYYDTIVIDTHGGYLTFASLVDNDKELKLYQYEINKRNNFYVESLRRYYANIGKYDIEKRKQSNSDFSHLIVNTKDSLEQVNDENELLTAYIYVRPEIDTLNKRVYDKLYANTSIPLLEEWMDYLINKFREYNYLRELTVDSIYETNPFKAYMLRISNSQLLEIVQTGIREHSIRVSNSFEDSELMSYIDGLDSYLNIFGEILANRIQNSFHPKFIPDVDSYDEYTNNYDDSCFYNGIELYQAQKSVIQSSVNNLNKNNVTFVIGEMGCGSIFAVLG
jgi:hypothetical protein